MPRNERPRQGSPEKLPPHDIAAEEAVIAACMVDEAAIPAVLSECGPNDFFREKNGWILDVIRHLWEQRRPVNQITVAHELARREQIEDIGGVAYLAQVVANVATTIGADEDARIVARDAVYRRLISAAGAIAQMAYEGTKPRAELAAEAYSKLDAALGEDRSRAVAWMHDSVRAGAEELMLELEEPARRRGLSWGFRALDSLTMGLEPGLLYMLALRTSHGKTTIALNSVWHLIERQHATVLYVSRELTDTQIRRRLNLMRARVDWRAAIERRYVTDEERERRLEAEDVLSRMPLAVEMHTGDIQGIWARAREFAGRHNLAVIFIDHIDRLSARGRHTHRQAEMAVITQGLKDMAVDLNIPVVALSQISRAVEGREDKAPTLVDLRESGTKEQDSQVVVLGHRPAMYEKDLPLLDPDYPREQRVLHPAQRLMVLDVAKNSDGPTGQVYLNMDVRTGLVTDWASPEELGRARDALEQWREMRAARPARSR